MNKKIRQILGGMLFAIVVMTSAVQNIASASTEMNSQTQCLIEDGLKREDTHIKSMDEGTHMVLQDVLVTSTLLSDNKIKITVTNTGLAPITEWVIAYEASYHIITIENAELTMNSEVKEFKALETNDILEVGNSIEIYLTISGIYEGDIEYRVYGLSDGSAIGTSVIDFITHDLTTGETSFTMVDVDESKINMLGDVCTKGEVIDSLSITDTMEPYKIIGADNRTLMPYVHWEPYRSIALLIIEWPYSQTTIGTGFMISDRYMLTAAHNLCHQKTGEIAESVTAYFEVVGNENNSKVSVTASTFSYCGSYPSYRYAPDYDWGCIRLSAAPKQGFFSIGHKSTELLNTKLGVTGYAYHTSGTGATGIAMFTAGGTPNEVKGTTIRYSIDVDEGQSGSPVYSSTNTAYGIHSGGASDPSIEQNYACRITPEMISLFVDNGWCSY